MCTFTNVHLLYLSVCLVLCRVPTSVQKFSSSLIVPYRFFETRFFLRRLYDIMEVLMSRYFTLDVDFLHTGHKDKDKVRFFLGLRGRLKFLLETNDVRNRENPSEELRW